jgi:hypothetical protein
MAYTDRFNLADDLITHLDTVVTGIADPFIASRYSGFVSVAAVTVFELAIKDIFFEFCDSKHRTFGVFTRNYFDRINGRIKYEVLHKDYVRRFGDKYVARFKKNMAKEEKRYFAASGKSIFSSYNNIIEWRNAFAHEGLLPVYATYQDVVDAYRTGKELIHCLARSMTR